MEKELIFGKAHYSEWLQDAPFENCLLDRKDFGEFIADYIISEKDGFVLNLNGSWGTGKTYFLQMLYAHLVNLRHPTVYIDAWESDFSKDPMSVIASELVSQLSKLNHCIGSEFTTLKSFFGKALKGTLIASSAIASKAVLGDSTAGAELMKALTEEKPQDIYSKITRDYQEQIDAIRSIRNELSALAETLATSYGANLPVVVLIDELDRCRPSYAIELLEVIKHFFRTKHFVFVVASDTEQLQYSIKSVYGEQFNSRTYLKRFFDREARLPPPDIINYVMMKGIDLHELLTHRYLKCSPRVDYTEVIASIISAYQLTIRDTDQVLSKLSSCISHATRRFKSEKRYFDVFLLTVAIIEQHTGAEAFEERNNTNKMPSIFDASVVIDRTSIETYIKLSIFVANKHKRYITNHFGRQNEELSTVRDEDLTFIPQEKSPTFGRYFSDVMNMICYGEVIPPILWSRYKELACLASCLD